MPKDLGSASFNPVGLPAQGMGQAQLADFLPVVHYRVIIVEFRDRMGDSPQCPLRVSSRAAEVDWIEGHW